MDIDIEYKNNEEVESITSPSVAATSEITREPIPVTIEAQDVEMLMNVIEEAAKRLQDQSPDMALKMMNTIDHVAKRVQVVEKHERKPAPKRVTYSLGQIVEVKCYSLNGLTWVKGKIVSGSGGGLFSVELGHNEVWDKISPDDLRPFHDTKGEPQFALSKRVHASWNLSTNTEKMIYSGWIWLYPSGWMGRSRTKRWAMLIDTSFYHGPSVNSDDWTVKKLQFSKIVEKESEKTIEVVNDEFDYKLLFQLECSYEYEVWLQQLHAAIERSKKSPERQVLENCETKLINHHKRQLVPLFEPGVQPELHHKPKAQGYLIQRSGDLSNFFYGTNWKRRWITLHSSWMSIRTDRAAVNDLEIIPLREVVVTSVKSEERIILVSGPFITNTYLWFDTDDMLDEWKESISTAIVSSNPEDHPGSRVREVNSDKRGIM